MDQQSDIQPADTEVTEPKTSKLAIASVIMSALTIFCVTWPFFALPAIICGIIALVKISNNKVLLKGKGLAVTGILIPLLVLIVAILVPPLGKVPPIAKRVVCAVNLKGLSTAMYIYTNDYDGILPTENWCDLLMQKADVSEKSFQCPLDPEGSFSYAINENLYKIAPDKVVPSQMVAIFEANLGRNGIGGPEDLVMRHDEHGKLGCNIAFADGYVEFVTEDRIADLEWAVE